MYILKFYVIGIKKYICWRLSSGFHDAIRFSHVVKENFEMHPISSCSNFVSLKITADGDCSHEIKRCLILGRKAMPKLDRVLKSRDVTLPAKVCRVKAIVFSVVMYGCEIWTIKKAVHQRNDAFKLWC